MTNYLSLTKDLAKVISPDRLITDQALCYTLGTDASLYRLTPKVIVKVKSINELQQVMALCMQYKTPYTFRAAGTSLSGQAISDSVLIMLTDAWKNHKVLEKGKKIRLQPGIIGADVNKILAPFNKKIGPDPASIESCKIGGIAANNSSGMCCGTEENTYHTLSSMTVVLADGAVLNTGDILSRERFETSHRALLDQLSDLADKTKANKPLSQLIEYKYRLKNTTGFSINSLIDFDDPIDILQHLMIGSEGCLGFIADITYQTVIESQFKATALYVFDDIESACRLAPELANLKVAAVELIDSRAIESISSKEGMPDFIKSLDSGAAALLLECHAVEENELQHQTEAVTVCLNKFNPSESIAFTQDKQVCKDLWQIRKGLLPAAGGMRKTGTSVIIEDIAFPVADLAEGTQALRELLDNHHYQDAIIFGHALVGNLHFVMTNDFSEPEQVRQYSQFMDELSELVTVQYKGSLKAEHGTGRNMAPYVEKEWGQAAYQLMQQIKTLFDPNCIMNPGVIINPDKDCHLANLKILAAIDPKIDKCLECGFCEAVCPSKNLSLTPRQRIVMYRQLQQLRKSKQTREVKSQIKALSKKFNYLAIETCATTGLCQDRCPVDINTGDLIRALKQPGQANNSARGSVLKWTAKHFSLSIKTVAILFGIKQIINKVFPTWLAYYPTASKSYCKPEIKAEKKVIFIPSCSSRSMGTQSSATDQRSIQDVTISLLEKAGFEIIIPAAINKLCCGMPYHSQGIESLAQQKSNELETILLQESEQGKWPVLMDSSPCKQYSQNAYETKLKIFEPFEFTEKFLLERLNINKLDETIMLHLTCSSRRMNLSDSLLTVAKLCATKIVVPEDIYCCGWAGSKGFTTAELNQAALATLKKQLPENCTRGFSNSLTCEIGLSQHSGVPYQSILYLIDEVSSVKTGNPLADTSN